MSRPRAFERRAGELASRSREHGMRPTPQREAIYRALVEAHDHPSPEVICARVRRAMPALSLATVYKTLEVLVRLGLADELPATGKTKRYDANMDRHHHVVCTRCGVVRDHYDAALDRLAEATRLRGFTVHRVSVHIHGQCERCARAAESRQPQSIRRRRSWPRS